MYKEKIDLFSFESYCNFRFFILKGRPLEFKSLFIVQSYWMICAICRGIKKSIKSLFSFIFLPIFFLKSWTFDENSIYFQLRTCHLRELWFLKVDLLFILNFFGYYDLHFHAYFSHFCSCEIFLYHTEKKH